MRTKRIGITGNIGSGKSYVCHIFENLGINVFYSDDETKALYLLPDIKKEIIGHFDDKIYFENRTLNTELLSSHLFKNKESLKFVESILYPALNSYFDKWIKEQKSEYVLFESALLFEKGFDKQFDKIIFVSAPEQVRLQRIMKRDSCDKENVRSRMRLQWDEDVKKQKSNFIIYNDGIKMLIPQVVEIHKKILNLK